MKAIVIILLGVLALSGCEREVSREVYSCKGPWQAVVLTEEGRALVTTAAGVREAVYITRGDTFSFTVPGREPVDLVRQGDRLEGELISCEKVLAE